MRNLRLDGSSSFIKYTFLEKKVIIEIGNKQNIEQLQHIADFVELFYFNKDAHQICTISDLNVTFGVTEPIYGNKDNFVLFHPDVMDMIPEVQKHISSFFHTPVPSRLFAIDENLDCLPKIDGVEESTLTGKSLEETSLERFFRTYPNQKRCKIFSNNIKHLEESSELFDLDCLYIGQSAGNAPMILKHFTESHLLLLKAELKMEDVMQFFQRWKSGEAYQNLEYLYIELQSGRFEPEMAITQLEATPFDQTKRPMNFNLSPKLIEWFASADIIKFLNCAGFWDIEREDGRLASIQIQWNFLRVCVWKDSQLKMDNNS